MNHLFRKRWSVALGVVVLAVAGSVAFLPRPEIVFFKPPHPLKELLPPTFASWTSEDVPLGETETLAREVEKTLQFSEAFFRIYRSGGRQVGVYLAYWNPGKADPWLVTLHTPDVCWSAAGGKITWKNDEKVMRATDGHLELVPGRARHFEWPRAAAQEVVYWHLYGGRLSGLPIITERWWSSRWEELILTLRNTGWGTRKSEHIFVRISTNGTLEELEKNDLWPELLRALGPTGLVKYRG